MASEESKKNPSKEPSNSELFASAKLVAEAAQSTLKNEGDKVDKAKAADAAGDLLDAAGQYGKLDDKQGVGQYVDKAADYLHQYQGGNTTTTPTPTPTPAQTDTKTEHKTEQSGGLGGLANLAGGFFNK